MYNVYSLLTCTEYQIALTECSFIWISQNDLIMWTMLSHSSAKACWKPDPLSYMGAIKVLPSIFVRMRSKMKMWWSCFMGQNEPTRYKFIFSCSTPHIPKNSLPHRGSCGNCWKSTKTRNESFLFVDFVYYVYWWLSKSLSKTGSQNGTLRTMLLGQSSQTLSL